MVKVEAGKKLSERIFAVAEDAVCYQENDIMLGLRYLNDLASKTGNAVSDLCSPRNKFGGHNGDSILADILDIYCDGKKQVCCSRNRQ